MYNLSIELQKIRNFYIKFLTFERFSALPGPLCAAPPAQKVAQVPMKWETLMTFVEVMCIIIACISAASQSFHGCHGVAARVSSNAIFLLCILTMFLCIMLLFIMFLSAVNKRNDMDRRLKSNLWTFELIIR